MRKGIANVFFACIVSAVIFIIILKVSVYQGRVEMKPKSVNNRVQFSFLESTMDKMPRFDTKDGVKEYMHISPDIMNLTISKFIGGKTSVKSVDKCQVRIQDLKKERFPMKDDLTLTDIWQPNMLPVTAGGIYHPSDCEPRENTAVIIPYRDREQHLDIALNSIHPLLQKQRANYRVFVIELAFPSQFNTGIPRNVGFVMAKNFGKFDCYVFHDVDLVPMSEQTIYQCRDKPTHLASDNSKFHGKSKYKNYFGGVVLFTEEQFENVNGYSNAYFGWGGEDDDIFERAIEKYGSVYHEDKDKGRYYALGHGQDATNPINKKKIQLLETAKERMDVDGLNSLKYDIVAIEFRPLYTWILVSVNEIEVMRDIP